MSADPVSRSPANDDAQLLRRYRQGEAAAFSMLYERHRLGLYRFLCGLCGDTTLAEEVFQDTWLSVVRSPTEQRAPVLFKTWLYQIARNRLIDHWRKQGRRQALQETFDEDLHGPASVAGQTPDPAQELSLSRDQERLQAALDDLPVEQREVFLLRAQGDLDVHAIAELTCTPAETVKSRLRYALQKLRRLLAEPAAAAEVYP